MDSDTKGWVTHINGIVISHQTVIENLLTVAERQVARIDTLEGRVLALEEMLKPFIVELEPKDLKGKKIPHLKVVINNDNTGE